MSTGMRPNVRLLKNRKKRFACRLERIDPQAQLRRRIEPESDAEQFVQGCPCSPPFHQPRGKSKRGRKILKRLPAGVRKNVVRQPSITTIRQWNRVHGGFSDKLVRDTAAHRT